MTYLPPQESAQFARFTAENRLYDLATPLGTDTLIVERLIGREALSTLTAWHIDCLSTGLHLPPSVCSASQSSCHWLAMPSQAQTFEACQAQWIGGSASSLFGIE